MKKNHGNHTEDVLERICHRIFGCDLVLRSPKLMEASGQKELVDFFVLLGDTVVLIQSKSLAIDIGGLDDTKLNRITRRRDKAKSQLSTALNAHTRGAEVVATTPLDVEFTIDWSHIKKKIGIVTLNLSDKQYSDPNLRFQLPFVVEDFRGVMVHTFFVNDLAQMVAELSTAGDFLSYLNAREKCTLSNKFVMNNELDFLAFYKTNYPEIEKALSDSTYHIGITSGYWEDYRAGAQERLQDRDRRFRNSTVIDNLIRELRTAIDFTADNCQISKQESTKQYLDLISSFAKLRRLERAIIGDKFIEKIHKTETKKWGYFMFMCERTDTAFLFLLLNEDDRERRKRFLTGLCVSACHKVTVPQLIGIASEGSQTRGHSIDAVLFDVVGTREKAKPDPEFDVFNPLEHDQVDEWSF